MIECTVVSRFSCRHVYYSEGGQYTRQFPLKNMFSRSIAGLSGFLLVFMASIIVFMRQLMGGIEPTLDTCTVAFCHPLSNQQGNRQDNVFRGDLAGDRIIQVAAFIFQRMRELGHLFINDTTIVCIQYTPVSLFLFLLFLCKLTRRIGRIDTVHLICHVYGDWECIDSFIYELRRKCHAFQSSFAHPVCRVVSRCTCVFHAECAYHA